MPNVTTISIKAIQEVLTRYRLHTATIREVRKDKSNKRFYDRVEVVIQPGLDNQTFIEVSRVLRAISPDITLVEKVSK